MKFRIINVFTWALVSVCLLAVESHALDPALEWTAKSQTAAGDKRTRLIGNVNIMYQNSSISADEVLLDIENKVADATGNVILWIDGQRIFGTYAHYDMNTQEGYLENAELDGEGYFAEGTRVDLLYQPAEGDKPDKRIMEIYGGNATTCDLAIPHYHASAGKIRLVPEERITANNMTFKVGDVPVMYMPYARRSLKERWHSYIFSAGYSDRKGLALYNKYILHFNDQFREAAYADYMTNMGYGLGWKHGWTVPKNWWDGHGRVSGYYFDQSLDEDNDDIDERPNDGGRWVLEGEMENNLLPDLRLTGKFLNYSDDDFEDDFESELVARGIDPDDLINGRNPFINLAWTQPDFNLRGLYKERLDDFIDFRLADDERKPELRWDVKRIALLDSPVYAKYHVDYTQLRKEIETGVDGDSTITSQETDRIDTDVQFEAPFSLFEWLRINPFVGYEFTHYQDSTFDRSTSYTTLDPFTSSHYGYETEYDDVDRHVPRYGVDLNTRQMVDLGDGFLPSRFDRMRLIMEPTLSYVDYFPSSDIRDVDYDTEDFLTPPDFISIDEVDTITDYSRVVRGRYDTRLEGKGGAGAYTLLRHSIQAGYDLRDDDGTEWEDLQSELFVNPYERWSLHNFVRYDLNEGQINSLSAGTSVQAMDRLALRAGYAEFDSVNDDDEHSVYWGAGYRISNKWLADYQHEFDIDDGKTRGVKVNLTRDMHDWDLIFSIRHRDREDKPNDTEFMFRISFKPYPNRVAEPEIAKDYVKYVEGTGYPVQ